jgi:twitching motility protein PilI
MVPSDMPSDPVVPSSARAQDVGAHDASAAWLAVEAGRHHYLLSLGDTGEIFPWTAPQPVPHTVAWFLGVANLRGGLYGVVRLEAFADADARSDAHRAVRRSAETPAPAPSRLIALHSRFDVNCALQVDRVIGLRGAELFEPAPDDDGEDDDATPGAAPAWRARTRVDAAGTRWRTLDLQALARHPRFLNVGT